MGENDQRGRGRSDSDRDVERNPPADAGDRAHPVRLGVGDAGSTDGETGASPATSGAPPTPGSRLRWDRRRFLIIAASFFAGLLAVVSFGFLGRGKGGGGGGGGTPLTDAFSDFPVRSIEDVPRVRPEEWTVRVDGLVETPLTIDYAAWAKLPRTDYTIDFHCVEGWTVDDTAWAGVAVAKLLEQAKPLPEGTIVNFHARGGEYFDNLTIEQARDPQVILADTLEGEPLTPDHGGPRRLVVPSQLGYKMVKWVERIELSSERKKGYWEQSGYPVEAPITGATRYGAGRG